MRAFKVGMVVWSCWVYEGKVEMEEWILRTIRRPKRERWHSSQCPPEKRAYFVQKVPGLTWVKKSKKHFDYGWAKNILSYYRREVRLGKGELPYGLYTTKLQAARAELKDTKAKLNGALRDERDGYRDWTSEDLALLVRACEKNVTAAKRNLTRIKNLKGGNR